MAKIAVTPSIVLAEYIWYKKSVTFSKVTCSFFSFVNLEMLLSGLPALVIMIGKNEMRVLYGVYIKF